MTDEPERPVRGMAIEMYAGVLADMDPVELAEHRRGMVDYLHRHDRDWASAAWMVKTLTEDIRERRYG